MEEVKIWLESFPGWGQTQLYLDMLPAKPGSAGLFPKGDTLLEIKEDLLGNVRCRCARQFQLLITVCDCAADWMAQFQHWVAQQSFLGLGPQFGEEQTLRAEKGQLKERTAAGSAVYTVTLTAEFVKKFMEGNYGKD